VEERGNISNPRQHHMRMEDMEYENKKQELEDERQERQLELMEFKDRLVPSTGILKLVHQNWKFGGGWWVVGGGWWWVAARPVPSARGMRAHPLITSALNRRAMRVLCGLRRRSHAGAEWESRFSFVRETERFADIRLDFLKVFRLYRLDLGI
jgi:hypothetical protein